MGDTEKTLIFSVYVHGTHYGIVIHIRSQVRESRKEDRKAIREKYRMYTFSTKKERRYRTTMQSENFVFVACDGKGEATNIHVKMYNPVCGIFRRQTNPSKK